MTDNQGCRMCQALSANCFNENIIIIYYNRNVVLLD